MNDDFLLKKINERKEANAFRRLKLPEGMIDFCSNDYLGIVKNNLIARRPDSNNKPDHARNNQAAGSTGSRLLTGNYSLIEEAEKKIAAFHDATTGLIFNSGYDANTGLLSCVPQKRDTVIYDQLSHASIRDGIRLSFATALPYRHNDLQDLEQKINGASGEIFVVTESVFSMDGDLSPLVQIAELCERKNAHLIIDEAHATGVIGTKGEGLVQSLDLQEKCMARIHTFGKACGAHGAIILGSDNLRNYLINFSRAFIYTTAPPASAIIPILSSYDIFPHLQRQREHLQQLIIQFQGSSVPFQLLESKTPIQGLVIPGNERVKTVATQLQEKGFDVRPILYPSVPRGMERLRIILHAFNSSREVLQLTELINTFAS